MAITLILSNTENILWDNPIPSCIYKYIETHSGLKKGQIAKNLKRHDSLLIESFRQSYGQYLESCPYAYLIEIPDYSCDVYDIIRIPCYASSFYPERISIDVERCLELYQGHSDYHKIKDELKHITTSHYGVKLKDSVKYTYVQQRFHVIKNKYNTFMYSQCNDA